MYESTHVYPALKAILQSRVRFITGVQRLLMTCRTHCPDPVWDIISAYDYGEELDRFTQWYLDNMAGDPPPPDIEVLWLAPQGIPADFNLRGSSRWSRDPEDWQWFYDDDYDGPSYHSKIVSDAYALTDHEAAVPKRKSPANHPHDVVELFYSLGIYGLCVRELVRADEPSTVLGDRSNRWIVVGHPDSLYGVILGKLTASRWQSYHG